MERSIQKYPNIYPKQYSKYCNGKKYCERCNQIVADWSGRHFQKRTCKEPQALHRKDVSKSTQGIAMERSIQEYQHERIQSIAKERTCNRIVADWSGRHSWEMVCTKSKNYCKAKKPHCAYLVHIVCTLGNACMLEDTVFGFKSDQV